MDKLEANMNDELTADMLLGGWYEYEPRGHHKCQIWNNRHLICSWIDVDAMWSDLDELGLTINEEGVIKEAV